MTTQGRVSHVVRQGPACAALCASLICGACTSFAPSGTQSMRVIPAGAAVTPAAPERSFFSVPLVASEEGGGSRTGKQIGSATLSVRRDNVLMYGMQIENTAGQTFTQAQVVRVTPDSAMDVIATLFADVMMRGARISIRGTASLSRSLPPDALLAHVREHPDQYQVVVRGERHPTGSLRGFLGAK